MLKVKGAGVWSKKTERSDIMIEKLEESDSSFWRDF